jgi:enoyl-CoA hydratase
VPADQLLPASLKLAQDIATAPPAKVQSYKRIIDQGFAVGFAEGMRLEHSLSTAENAKVTPDAVAKAREGVMERGRGQTS